MPKGKIFSRSFLAESKQKFIFFRFYVKITDMTRLEQLMKYLGDAPNDSFLLFAIAKEYEGLEDNKMAFEYYNILLTEHENYVGTYYHLGKLYEKTEDEPSAIEIYKKGMLIAQQQGDKHAYGELATAKMSIDDDEF
jgi:tetratricopeptide (TPR) repeat protein